jgi:hypothetical protein
MDVHSTEPNTFGQYTEELIKILKKYDVASQEVKEFLDRHIGIEYFGEIQSVLDIKELLDVGLIK